MAGAAVGRSEGECLDCGIDKTELAGLKTWRQLLLFVLVAAAIISRRPDALFHPQFYAEDGAVWYAQAYNLGWLHSLTIPEGGYLNTLPRLVCGLALFVPLRHAPAVLNAFGLLIQVLPVMVLLSGRCAAWGSLPLRALQAAVYIALPNSNELDVTITNAHWHLVLVICLIAFAGPPRNRWWMGFDIAVCVVGGLTGPWAIVLTPLVLVFWWLRRQRWSLVVAAVLGICAVIQSAELAASATRPVTPLGATPQLLLRLIAGNVYMGAVWGQNGFAVRGPLAGEIAVFLLGSAILGYCLYRGRLELKLFIAFSLLILAASLYSPLIIGPLPRWQLLAIDKGGRYWFFPMLALLWSMLYCGTRKSSRLLLLVFLSRGIWHDWRYWAYKDENFGVYARQFEQASAGTKMTFPIYPDGHSMELIKR